MGVQDLAWGDGAPLKLLVQQPKQRKLLPSVAEEFERH